MKADEPPPRHEPEFGRLKLGLVFFGAFAGGMSQISELPSVVRAVCGVLAASCGAALAYLLTPPTSASFKPKGKE